ncbi:MEIOTIC F-BOX protein MOF-like [Oryza glaberrima]|uniref:F-box domain-containing protein n=1 Tax=Oryza glaberrima TaxID=4538 RepID=I1PLJ5_ORYGL|nr:MEIOTIC F-BOX protein MOF-like [Oryza glaberrima]
MDRLSALPDGLLHAVMSFLPARQMAQTCVLSKRWVHLWRSVPSLNLDIREFRNLSKEDDDDDDETWGKMKDFIANLLMFHHAPTLDTFTVCTGVVVQAAVGNRSRRNHRHNDINYHAVADNRRRDVGRWIRGGIKYCPRVLDVAVAPSGSGCRPPPDLGSGSCCRRLERLRLSCFALDSGFARQVRDSCPVLRCLELHRCHIQFSHIESSTLNKLVIEGCIGCSLSLAISAPRLASLCLDLSYGAYKNGVSLNGLNSLVEASVTLNVFQISPEGEAMLLCGLFNVTNLELEAIHAKLGGVLGAKLSAFGSAKGGGRERRKFYGCCNVNEKVILHEKFDKFSSFNNLRTLSLDDCFQGMGDLKEKFKALGRLLEKCPNLEKLTLQHCWFLSGSTQRAEIETRTSGLCLQSQDQVTFHCQKLKLIEIKHDSELCCDHQLFQLMWGFWKDLKKATIILTKL